MTLTEIANQVEHKRNELKAFLDSKKDAQGQLNMKASDIVEFNQRNDELGTLASDLKTAQTIADAQKANDASLADMKQVNRSVILPAGASRKSPGELFTETAAFKNRSNEKVEVDYDVKTAMTTVAGFAPFVERSGDIVNISKRPTLIADYLRKVETSQYAVKYMQQTLATNNAVETAEGAAPGEAAFTWGEVTVAIQEIPTEIPVTNIQLDDVPMIQDLINSELSYQLMNRLDGQIINGDGTGVNIKGVLAQAGLKTQSKGATTFFNAIGLAMSKVEISDYSSCNAVIIHPSDYWTMRLSTSTTGSFLFGDPSLPGPSQIFGADILRSKVAAVGLPIAGDFNQTYLAVRRGVTLEYGWINDQFTKGIRCIRASVRVALVVRRPSSFCEVIA